MATTRRPRQMTFRGLKRRIDREERRVEQKTLGQWWGIDYNQTLTTGPTARGVGMTLTTPEGSPATDKIEIYAVDSLISILCTSKSNTPIVGALLACHVRHGQASSDFVAAQGAMPKGLEFQPRARARAYLPFTVMPLQDQGDSGSNLVIPYRPFRGRRLTLLDGEQLVIRLALSATSQDGISLKIAWHGRYRYIIGKQT